LRRFFVSICCTSETCAMSDRNSSARPLGET
jgi:hypothetical protein